MSEDWEKELGLDTDGIEEAREANKEKELPAKRKEDERFWKPRIPKGETEYEAVVRILPPSVAWLENRHLPWSVEVQTHYVKDEKNPEIGFSVKCRKMLGRDEKCPICDYNWAVWREAKARNDKATMTTMVQRSNKISHIGNFLIVDDVTTPSFNGEVKLWDHTARMNGWLNAPMIPPKEEKEAVDADGKNKYRKKKKVEEFNALHPTKGRNFLVFVDGNSSTKGNDGKTIISYDDSEYLTETSSIASSKDELISVLERCYPLDEFINDVPTIEQLSIKYQEFRDKVADAGGIVPTGDSIQQSVPNLDKLSPGVPTSNIDQGDADELFDDKKATKTSPSVVKKAETPKAEPKKETVAVTESASAPEVEDDLPF